MNFSIQSILRDEIVMLSPLEEEDFETLFAVASDPLIWEQHPVPTRYQLEVFSNYFRGAIESKGAFGIYDVATSEIIGSTRYYDYNEKQGSILIGYTFIARKYWGKTYNYRIKKLMLDYIFQFVSTVIFHIGINNTRSRIAMERIGGVLQGSVDTAYFGEVSNENCIYEIKKEHWAFL
jgi:N-acetyltransferase